MVESKHLELYVGNLDCEHDAAAIERGLDNTSGLVERETNGLRAFDKADTFNNCFREQAIT